MSFVFAVEVKSSEETINLGKRLAQLLEPSSVITLEGDLGAGKTIFTKGIAEGLGIKEMVNSPTYVIIKEYNGILPLYHMDVYRLGEEVEDLGFDEYFYGTGVTVIEWAKLIEDFLPEQFLNIRIDKIDSMKRKISFEPFGERYIKICEEFFKHEDSSY